MWRSIAAARSRCTASTGSAGESSGHSLIRWLSLWPRLRHKGIWYTDARKARTGSLELTSIHVPRDGNVCRTRAFRILATVLRGELLPVGWLACSACILRWDNCDHGAGYKANFARGDSSTPYRESNRRWH